MNAVTRPTRAMGLAIILAAAAFAVVTANSSKAAQFSPAAAAQAVAAPKSLVFGQGAWTGSGRRHELFKDGPYPLEIDTRISFKLKVDASGVVNGTFRQVGTSTPKGNGWGGQMKHVIDAKLAGGAGNAISIVGKISTGGTITYKGNGVPLASTKPYRAWLGPTSASCNVVGSKYWTARRVAGTGKPPAAATIKQTEQNALLALDRAQPVSRDLRSVTGWLYKLNFQIEAARRCGVAPVGYARGLAGRADIVTKLSDLLKSLVGQGAQYSGYGLEPYDVVDLVNSAVDTGAIGDTTVKQGLETWMDQALTDVLGKPGAEGVVDYIEWSARRAGMSSVANRAAKG